MNHDTIKSCDGTEPTVVITVGPVDRSDGCWECPPLPVDLCMYKLDEGHPYRWPEQTFCTLREAREERITSGYRPRQLASSYG